MRRSRVLCCGSSPRARGTHINREGARGRLRFIPAGAGNTTGAGHPSDSPGGSSPRARGTHPEKFRGASRPRFIPAGAGNTPAHRGGSGRAPVHPRGRGEHFEGLWAALADRGSSPRARGTRLRQHPEELDVRFIPAGAGNTSHPGPCRVHTAVHPRGRGEHALPALSSTDPDGSSPRARGTHLVYQTDLYKEMSHRHFYREHGMQEALSQLSKIEGTWLRVEAHQPHTIPLDGKPAVGSQRLELEPNRIVRPPGNDSATVLDALFDVRPDMLSHFPGKAPDVYASTEFEQPYGQPPA